MHYLIVPGLNNSGPSHWQTFWTKSLPSASRVYQHCWDKPQKEDWIATLDEAVRQLKDDTILVSHSLGVVTTALWLLRARKENALPENIKGAVNICTYILISALMIRICAGKCNFKELIRGTAILFGVTFCMAGSIYMIYYYTYAGYWIRMNLLSDTELLMFTALSVVIVGMIIKQIMVRIVYGESECLVKIIFNDKCFDLKGYIDTGNVLKDPYFKKSVSIVDLESLNFGGDSIRQLILDDIELNTKVKYHMIPYNSLGCESGMLEVITVDSMYIYTKKKVYAQKNALIGLSTVKLSSDNEFDVLVNIGAVQAENCIKKLKFGGCYGFKSCGRR